METGKKKKNIHVHIRVHKKIYEVEEQQIHTYGNIGIQKKTVYKDQADHLKSFFFLMPILNI